MEEENDADQARDLFGEESGDEAPPPAPGGDVEMADAGEPPEPPDEEEIDPDLPVEEWSNNQLKVKI